MDVFWRSAAERWAKKLLISMQMLSQLRRHGPRQCIWAVEITLVTPSRMRKINHRYRGHDAVTDVLSFPVPQQWPKQWDSPKFCTHPFYGQGFLGSIVICFSALERQARVYRVTRTEELIVLLVHGLLHLLGFDHETSARDAQKMSTFECKILGQILSQMGKPSPSNVIAGLIARKISSNTNN